MFIFLQRQFRRLVFCASVFVLTASSYQVSAQSNRFDVTGSVTDSLGVGLRGATVVALTQADSILTKFGTTAANGSFSIKRVPEGKYILQVTYVGFQTYRKNFDLTAASFDAGQIKLEESVGEMGELIVSSEHIPMVFKGDTLEFNAAAFGVRPNAVVEDLLRRLPGVEVAEDGTIKAQGKDVQNVLVDGKEFFGNDYKVATKNLTAEAISKVQVYDKRSDMAEFTGVEDGAEEKTINLELKEDHKQGYFGNMSGGYSAEGRYDGQASVNRFSSTTQLSFLGNLNNINRQGFSFGDYINFVGGMGSGSFSMGGGGPQIGTNLSDGFSNTLSLGLNASRDFGSKVSIRSSYFVSNIENEQDRNVQQQQVLGSSLTSSSLQNSNQISDNLTHRGNLNVKYTWKKGHDLQLRSNLTASTSSLSNIGFRETSGGSGSILNSSQTDYSSNGDRLGGDASLTYRKRLNENGRSLVVDARADLNDSETTGDLNSTTGLFMPGDVATYDEIIQYQSSLGNTLTQTQKLSLSEPLGNGRLIELRGERRSINEDQDKTVFDLLNGGRTLNALLSSGLDRTYTYYKGGLNFTQNWEKVYMGIGVDVQESSLDGKIADHNTEIKNGYTNVLPSANVRYSIKDGMSLFLRYNASTREPSMTELQPFPDNSDPLNVYYGNPELIPEYRHNANLNYHYFDQFTFVNLFAYVSANYTENKIARSRTIDSQLRQEITSVNTDGYWSFNGSVHFGAPIRKLGMKFNISNSATLSKGIEFINSVENSSDILRNTVDLTLENRTKDIFDIRVGAQYTFNDVKYSLNRNQNQNYVNRSYNANLSYYIGETWEISTSLDYRVYTQQLSGSSTNIPLWQATISKTLLNQRADLQIVGLDLLDKNQGINFSNVGNSIQEERINSLGRYIMLKFVYRLSKSSTRGGGMKVMQTHSM
mgnify:CR=1 FL=1|jgi:hypothetical protein